MIKNKQETMDNNGNAGDKLRLHSVRVNRMALATLDLVLIFVTGAIVVADIAMAICLGFVLPYHVTRDGYYSISDDKVSYDEAVKICPCLSMFNKSVHSEIIFNSKAHQIRKKRSIRNNFFEMNHDYNYLVSLTIPAFVDDTERIFACNGVITSPNTLITTKKCVKDESEWPELRVRSGSLYWSDFGEVHAVINASTLNSDGLMSLTVAPDFPPDLVNNSVKFPPNDSNWSYGITVGWDEDMYDHKLNERFKFKPFQVERWTKKIDGMKMMKPCKEMSSKALITSTNQLVGMKMIGEGNCNEYFNLFQGGETLWRGTEKKSYLEMEKTDIRFIE